jgi:hypothetical protein
MILPHWRQHASNGGIGDASRPRRIRDGESRARISIRANRKARRLNDFGHVPIGKPAAAFPQMR